MIAAPPLVRRVIMRHKSKLRLVRDSGNAPEPISTLSPDEQAHLLDLADLALNGTPGEPIGPAGSRAKRDHKALKEEVQDVLERFERGTNDAA
jgi:hypothetical protein